MLPLSYADLKKEAAILNPYKTPCGIFYDYWTGKYVIRRCSTGRS